MKFRQKYFEGQKDFYKNLVEQGQQPKYLVVACSDSRVDPSLILNCKPGDLFVIRNVANLIPPYEIDTHYHGTSAALEFGICGLEIEEIILLGHSQCGGMLSLVSNQGQTEGNFISKWMELAQVSCETTLGEKQDLPALDRANLCAKSALLGSLNNLQSFPWISDRLKAGKLSIHLWYFDLASGLIYSYDQNSKEFEPL